VARASPGCKTWGSKGAAARGGRYMRLGYAHMDNLPFAAIKNRAGSYVTPDPNPAASLAVALPSSIASPRWDRVNLAVNGAPSPGPEENFESCSARSARGASMRGCPAAGWAQPAQPAAPSAWPPCAPCSWRQAGRPGPSLQRCGQRQSRGPAASGCTCVARAR